MVIQCQGIISSDNIISGNSSSSYGSHIISSIRNYNIANYQLWVKELFVSTLIHRTS